MTIFDIIWQILSVTIWKTLVSNLIEGIFREIGRCQEPNAQGHYPIVQMLMQFPQQMSSYPLPWGKGDKAQGVDVIAKRKKPIGLENCSGSLEAMGMMILDNEWREG